MVKIIIFKLFYEPKNVTISFFLIFSMTLWRNITTIQELLRDFHVKVLQITIVAFLLQLSFISFNPPPPFRLQQPSSINRRGIVPTRRTNEKLPLSTILCLNFKKQDIIDQDAWIKTWLIVHIKIYLLSSKTLSWGMEQQTCNGIGFPKSTVK